MRATPWRPITRMSLRPARFFRSARPTLRLYVFSSMADVGGEICGGGLRRGGLVAPQPVGSHRQGIVHPDRLGRNVRAVGNDRVQHLDGVAVPWVSASAGHDIRQPVTLAGAWLDTPERDAADAACRRRRHAIWHRLDERTEHNVDGTLQSMGADRERRGMAGVEERPVRNDDVDRPVAPGAVWNGRFGDAANRETGRTGPARPRGVDGAGDLRVRSAIANERSP